MATKKHAPFFYPFLPSGPLYFLTLKLCSVNKLFIKKEPAKSKIYLVNSENIPTFVVYKY